MLGVAYLLAFEISGLMLSAALGFGRGVKAKIWLGLVTGLMELMWLPSVYAFIFDFDITAHMFALLTALVLGASALIISAKKGTLRIKPKKRQAPLWLVLLLVVPLTALAGYLNYTHSFMEIDGALYVGQSTYGDLCMHAGFITGLIGQSYPPEYTLLPGARLGYPFLADAMSSSMYLFGSPLSLSIIIPGTLMALLVFLGIIMLAWEMTKSKAATALTLIMVAFGGGLGFIYYFDMNASLDLSTLTIGGAEAGSAVNEALNGYYFAPANYPPLNLRWVNALCDLLIPQRTLLAGWMCLVPALYMLYTAMRKYRLRDFMLLGAFAGAMPMVHTHSFLGLGVISLGAMADAVIRNGGMRKQTAKCFLCYGMTAALIALPQLLIWTFPQTIEGGSIKLLFNWVNNNGDGSFKDNYIWFWLKNVGPMFVIIPLAALLCKDKRKKALSLGSLMLFILAETVIFQPNVYDNNKLFWVAYLCMLPVGCKFVCDLISEHKSAIIKSILALIMLFVFLTSGVMSVIREVKSGEKDSAYMIFSENQVKAAEFINENTPKDAVFLTANNHNNAVATLTGRKIVCGAGTYLFFHGVDYRQNETDAKLMLSYPAECEELFQKYAVDYIFISNYELSQTGATFAVFDGLYPVVYQSSGEAWYDAVKIYAVSDRAKSAITGSASENE